MSDILDLKIRMAAAAPAICRHLLPNGRVTRNEFHVGAMDGRAGDSLKVRLTGAKAGLWADFAEGGSSGDLIDLWQAVKGVQLPEALDEIRAFLGVQKPAFEKAPKTYKRPARPKCGAPKSAVREYLLTERKVSSNAIRAYKVGEQDRVMVFPMILPAAPGESGVLANVKYRAIDREPGKQPRTWAEADAEPVLFGWQAINRDARAICLVEGEIDALTMYDYGFPALSIPFGGGAGQKQQWIEREFERMGQFETIYLALDMDGEGEAAATEIASRLGRHRCRRVVLPHKDINLCRQKGVTEAEIRACFDRAKSLDPPELRKPSDYEDRVIALFWPASGAEPGYAAPFAKLSDKVRFRPGELSIWSGATTMGKSQILSFATVAWGAQGAKVCVASLEMAPAQFIRRMVKQASNTDRTSEAMIRATIAWLDEFLWIFAVVGKSKIERILEVFEYARARYGCDVFVLDSLMRVGVGSEDYEGQERVAFTLVDWSVANAVHLHLVAHARKSDRDRPGAGGAEDVKGASEISANAANVLIVWRNKALEDTLRTTEARAAKGDVGAEIELSELREKPPVILNVDKQRNGDWDGKIGLWFDRATYRYRDSWDDHRGAKFVPAEFWPEPSSHPQQEM